MGDSLGIFKSSYPGLELNMQSIPELHYFMSYTWNHYHIRGAILPREPNGLEALLFYIKTLPMTLYCETFRFQQGIGGQDCVIIC